MEEPTIKKQVGRYMLHAESLSRAQLFVIPWILACQAPPSMGFSRQGYWSGLPFPSPRDLPYSEIKPAYLESSERKQETMSQGLCEARKMKGLQRTATSI